MLSQNTQRQEINTQILALLNKIRYYILSHAGRGYQ